VIRKHARCIALCVAKRLDFEAVCNKFTPSGNATRYRDSLYLQDNGDIVVFSYGVLVLWDIDEAQQSTLIESLGEFTVESFAEPYHDEFGFSEGESVVRVHGDHIHIEGNNPIEKLAISHALAQSVKLMELEDGAESTIRETEHIPHNMARTGSSKLGRHRIARMRGRLFLVQSEINLQYALLDTPEFFWEHPEVEGHYTMLSRYLEVKSRIELLNRKLGVIHDIFSMLADEQKHRHSSFLEWIIIWLIAVDIVLIGVHDILGWI
jgi:uncharacterized Rmd1/YagE family protein